MSECAPNPTPTTGSPSGSIDNKKSEGTIEKTLHQGKNAPKVNVNNGSDGLKLSVLTSEEQEMVTRGENAKIILNVINISDSVSDEEKQLIQEALTQEKKDSTVVNKPVLYIDLSLYKKVGNSEETKVTRTNRKI